MTMTVNGTKLSLGIVAHGALGGLKHPSNLPISERDLLEYLGVIEEALTVHLDRERIRQGLWKEYPAEDQCNQIKVKIDRTLRSLERMASMGQVLAPQERTDITNNLRENAIEELYDIINYANFAVRILEGKV